MLHMTYFDIYLGLSLLKLILKGSPPPKKWPLGAIHKVENNFSDSFGLKNDIKPDNLS